MPVSLRAPQARVLLRSRPPTTSLSRSSSSSSSSITSLLLLRHPQQLNQHDHHHHYFSTTSATSSPPPSSKSPSSPPPSLAPSASHTVSTNINPPASTRPAALALPSALSPSASPADKLKHFLAVGRAYLTFYKTGLKNVYHNHRAAVPLRRALGVPAHLPTSAYLAVTQEALVASKGSSNGPTPTPTTMTATTTTATNAKNSNSNSNRPGVISRAGFQLLHRAAYDIRRMIPFTLLLIVCGEFTPLVVLALGNAVTPRTCRVPRQLEKERAKRVQRKKWALLLDRGTVAAPEVGSEKEMKSVRWLMRASGAGDREAVARACAVFGLARSHDRLAWPLLPVYRRRLERYLNYLEVDDELIRRGGGVQAMEAAEVRIAVEERGGAGVGSQGNGRNGWEMEREERRWLEKWLQWRD